MIITKLADYPLPLGDPEGEIIQELLGIKAGKVDNHSLARITIPPGKASIPHFHRMTNESYLILAGSAKMQIDAKAFNLESGEVVLVEPGEVHQITNLGDQDLIFLAVCVPAWEPGDSFEAELTEQI